MNLPTLSTVLTAYTQLGIILLLFVTVLFLVAYVKEDNSIVDVAWGPGIILVALLAYLWYGSADITQAVLLGLVFLWGMRLAVSVAVKNRGRGEDRRYQAWREQWGKMATSRSYGQVFLFQGILMLVIALPIVLTMMSVPVAFGTVPAIGLAVWTVGLLFEMVGDSQLHRFKRNPHNHGKLLTGGLWRYSRHPNYFGEALLWWGIFLITYPTIGWWGLVASVTVTLLVRFVSGVPMAEKHYAGRADFADYRRRTSAFIPWFPRRRS